MSLRKEALKYMGGFGNVFQTEAMLNALPKGQNSPQKCAYGLFAEQLTGSAFTMPRHQNKWAWTYRINPSVIHSVKKGFKLNDANKLWVTPPFSHPTPPDQYRWDPLPSPSKPTDFIDGLVTMVSNGSPASNIGGSCLLYSCNKSMSEGGRYFYSGDADMLFIPHQGRLLIKTEMGDIDIEPLEIAVVPRGVKFQVNLPDGEGTTSAGYVCENFGAHFVIPDLGPIGSSSGLANPRHFLAPEAKFEEKKGPFELVCKFQGNLWHGEIPCSPLDVVAWYGNYTPYKYDLRLFNCMNSVTFDHPDPSIYTVLTSPSAVPGHANMDFVVFPPRWVTMENTFRPPWYHRNIMSEWMGLIHGAYDAKPQGFVPGGSSLHNCMTPHGPDANAFEKAIKEDTTKPERYKNTMAFMLESGMTWHPSQFALQGGLMQKDYMACWEGIKSHFDKNDAPPTDLSKHYPFEFNPKGR